MNNLMTQLLEMHRAQSWQDPHLTNFELMEMYGELIEQDRLIVAIEDSKILGYCEWTRVNLAQLGYLTIAHTVSNAVFDPDGLIVWVTNLYIKPNYRRLAIIGYFKRELFKRNPYAEFIAGRHQGKRLKPIAVFRKHQLAKGVM